MYATGYIGLPLWLRYSSQACISGNTRTWGFCPSSIRLLSLLSVLSRATHVSTNPCWLVWITSQRDPVVPWEEFVSLKSDRARSWLCQLCDLGGETFDLSEPVSSSIKWDQWILPQLSWGPKGMFLQSLACRRCSTSFMPVLTLSLVGWLKDHNQKQLLHLVTWPDSHPTRYPKW